MADNSATTILGSQKKAATDGTDTRKKMNGWGKTLFIIIASVALVLFIIYGGYRIFGNDDTRDVPDADGRPQIHAPTNVTVPWSRKITVAPRQWSNEISVSPQECFQITFYGASGSSNEFLQANSSILPWESDRWIPNNGGEFQAIRIGCSDRTITFTYRVLPHRCS